MDRGEQKQAEAALRDRERELSQLVDMVPSLVWRLTPDGAPTFFNRRMADFLGLDVADTERSSKSRLDALIEIIHPDDAAEFRDRSEEHTSELQSLMRISYAVFCLKKKKKHNINANHPHHAIKY